LVFSLGLFLYPITFSSAPSADRSNRAAPQPSIAADRRPIPTNEPRHGPLGIESLKQASALMEQGPRKGLYRVDTAGIPGLKGNVSTQESSAALAVGQWSTFEAHLIGGASSGSEGHGYGIGLFDKANSGLSLVATNNLVYVLTYNSGTYSGNLWAHTLNLQDGKMHKFAMKACLTSGSNEIRFVGYVDNAKVLDRTTTSITTMGLPGPAVFGEVAREVYFRPDLKFTTHD
jgi:hypothetical protein